MMDTKDIYVSLDEAREELKKKWKNVELRKKIEDELGEKFMPVFRDKQRGVISRHIFSPDNGFTFFYQCLKYVGAEPLVSEYHDDIFVHFNEEKKGLGRLRVVLKDGTKAIIDIMDFHANEKKKLGECTIKTGEKLVDFHHNLIKVLKCPVDILENSKWFKNIGKASNYYYCLLLHFVAHGVFFENFVINGDGESDSEVEFTHTVVFPAIASIEQKYGLKPLIVRLYPKQQSDEEDFYWWCYPPYVNEYIIDYAQRHNLPIRQWRKRRKR